MTDVNLSTIDTVTFNNVTVDNLVVDGQRTWMKNANGSFAVGQIVYINGQAQVITSLGIAPAENISYLNGAGGTATVNSGDSSVSLTDPGDTSGGTTGDTSGGTTGDTSGGTTGDTSGGTTGDTTGDTTGFTNSDIGRTVYAITDNTARGFVANEVYTITSVPNSTTARVNVTSGNGTLRSTHEGAQWNFVLPNTTSFSANQVVYINGLQKKTIKFISGSLITFTDNTTLDNNDLGGTTIDLVGINNTGFANIDDTLWLDGVQQKTVEDIIDRTIYWTDGTSTNLDTDDILVTVNQPPPPNNTGYEVGDLLLVNGEQVTIFEIDGDNIKYIVQGPPSSTVVVDTTNPGDVVLGAKYQASNIPWKVSDQVVLWTGMTTVDNGGDNTHVITDITDTIITITLGSGVYGITAGQYAWSPISTKTYDWSKSHGFNQSSNGVSAIVKIDYSAMYRNDPNTNLTAGYKIADGTGFIEEQVDRSTLYHGWLATYVLNNNSFLRYHETPTYPGNNDLAIDKVAGYPGNRTTNLYADEIELTATGVIVRLKTISPTSPVYTATMANGNWSYNPSEFNG